MLGTFGCLCFWNPHSYMLAHMCILLFWLLGHSGQHSSDFSFLLPTCLLPIGTSLPLILLLILAKLLPLLSASSLLAARASSQQPIIFCSHFIHPPPLHTRCILHLPPKAHSSLWCLLTHSIMLNWLQSISPAYPAGCQGPVPQVAQLA